MRSPKFLLAAAALAGLSAPAGAQWYGGYTYNAPPPPYGYPDPAYRRPLPRDVVVERLEDLGFDDVGRPRFDGDVYVVEATGRRAGPVRLVVDAYSGRILRQSPLGMARLGPDEFGSDLDGGPGPGRRAGPSRFDEMPNAPRFRDPPVEAAPLQEAARPPEPGTVAPPPGVDRSRPADPRVAPDAIARPSEGERTRQEARRPAEPDAAAPPAAGGLYGVNPDRKAGAKPAPKPKESVAAKPADAPAQRPAAKAAPDAPAPGAVPTREELKPVPPGQSAEAAGERRPVRVIQGVTPLNSGGGQQSSPGPRNNEAKATEN